MIEDVLDPEKLERQCNEKDIVRRVATLYDLKAPAEIDPPRVEKFPK
jgi:hypothetical protein